MVDYIVECSIMDGKRKVMFYEKNNPRMTYEELDKTPWSKDIQRELKFLSKLFEMRIKGGLRGNLVGKFTPDNI
ncbi:MAG TPA: hypothetical protein VJB35_01445 [Candidatus Nanoarchaeia archaeon]|nr:hypothetical protein [Candidatus Nanoarchaeia archaeon]